MKKTVYVYTEETGEDAYIFEADPDATPDELYQAAYVLYPKCIKVEIVLERGEIS
jgi:hypothetical protein